MSREIEVDVPRDDETINVMVVSDVRLYREGLAGSLAQRHRLAVVCTANNVDDMSRLVACDPGIAERARSDPHEHWFPARGGRPHRRGQRRPPAGAPR